jgi:hypothetical protein
MLNYTHWVLEAISYPWPAQFVSTPFMLWFVWLPRHPYSLPHWCNTTVLHLNGNSPPYLFFLLQESSTISERNTSHRNFVAVSCNAPQQGQRPAASHIVNWSADTVKVYWTSVTVIYKYLWKENLAAFSWHSNYRTILSVPVRQWIAGELEI